VNSVKFLSIAALGVALQAIDIIMKIKKRKDKGE
jgi:hypothetical protein